MDLRNIRDEDNNSRKRQKFSNLPNLPLVELLNIIGRAACFMPKFKEPAQNIYTSTTDLEIHVFSTIDLSQSFKWADCIDNEISTKNLPLMHMANKLEDTLYTHTFTTRATTTRVSLFLLTLEDFVPPETRVLVICNDVAMEIDCEKHFMEHNENPTDRYVFGAFMTSLQNTYFIPTTCGSFKIWDEHSRKMCYETLLNNFLEYDRFRDNCENIIQIQEKQLSIIPLTRTLTARGFDDLLNSQSKIVLITDTMSDPLVYLENITELKDWLNKNEKICCNHDWINTLASHLPDELKANSRDKTQIILHAQDLEKLKISTHPRYIINCNWLIINDHDSHFFLADGLAGIIGSHSRFIPKICEIPIIICCNKLSLPTATNSPPLVSRVPFMTKIKEYNYTSFNGRSYKSPYALGASLRRFASVTVEGEKPGENVIFWRFYFENKTVLNELFLDLAHTQEWFIRELIVYLRKEMDKIKNDTPPMYKLKCLMNALISTPQLRDAGYDNPKDGRCRMLVGDNNTPKPILDTTYMTTLISRVNKPYLLFAVDEKGTEGIDGWVNYNYNEFKTIFPHEDDYYEFHVEKELKVASHRFFYGELIQGEGPFICLPRTCQAEEVSKIIADMDDILKIMHYKSSNTVAMRNYHLIKLGYAALESARSEKMKPTAANCILQYLIQSNNNQLENKELEKLLFYNAGCLVRINYLTRRLFILDIKDKNNPHTPSFVRWIIMLSLLQFATSEFTRLNGFQDIETILDNFYKFGHSLNDEDMAKSIISSLDGRKREEILLDGKVSSLPKNLAQFSDLILVTVSNIMQDLHF